MRSLVLSGLFYFFIFQISAQDYFQQEVNYTISVKLNDIDHSLSGHEKIEYHNNSLSMLNEIYFHIWANAYKDNSTALNKQKLEANDFGLNFSPIAERGYMDSLSFTQDGVGIEFETTKDVDIILLKLNKPILSGESSIIETPFYVKIPDGRFSRLGHTEQAYYITQWYPKPAVFDKEGWHPMPYFDQGEFYSEFGSFDVSIGLPENYVVGATGDLQEKSEIDWLKQKAKETAELKDRESTNETFPTSSTAQKTISFKQSNVHDFAWFADKRFNVLHGTVEIPESKDTVNVWSMFTNAEYGLWKNSIEYLKDAVYYYSLWNGDYPYKHCTAIDGTISAGGGMEYPNITIIGSSNNAKDLERVIVHEVGHNWFYGILGTNERSYPWMDEGINSYYEHRYFDTKYSGESSSISFLFELDVSDKKMSDLSYFLGTSRNSEQPIQYHSNDYSSINYGTIVYEKASFAMHYLSHFLGEELFDECMHTYFDIWKFKHPGPEDLQNVFEKTTGQNLAWFFDQLIMNTLPIDHKLCCVKDDGKTVEIEVKNKTKYKTPISVGLFMNDSLVSKKWIGPFKGKKNISFLSRTFDEVRLDPDYQCIQASRKNDHWKKKALIKTWEPLGLKFGTRLRERARSNFYFIPTIGWNKSDELMTGLSLHNLEPLSKELEFNVHPMYSFETDNINGYARLNWNLKPDLGPLKWTEIFAESSRFSFKQAPTEQFRYEKYTLGLHMQFRPVRLRTNNTFDLTYRYIHINDIFDIDEIRLNSDSVPFNYSVDTTLTQNYHDILFSFQDNNSLLHNHSNINLRASESVTRLTLEHKSRYFYKKGKAFDLRLFGGKIIMNDEIFSNAERFMLSGSNNNISQFGSVSENVDGSFRSANQDYLYDDVMLARTDTSGFLGRQLFMGQGGFKSPVSGLSPDWLVSINFEADIPAPINVGLFVSYGFSPQIKVENGEQVEEVRNYSEFGIKLTVLRDYLTVYFPLVYDLDGDGESDQSDLKFGKTISFQLALRELSLRNLRKKIPY